MKVKDVMTHPVISCPADTTLDTPARLMWEFDCGAIVATDRDGRLAGIITDRDIAMAALSQGKPLHEIAVTSAMASDVSFCHELDSVDSAERVMQERQVRRVPVADVDGRPVGIVTLNDVARLAARTRKAGVDRELVATLAAVCQPRTELSAARIPRPLVVAG